MASDGLSKTRVDENMMGINENTSSTGRGANGLVGGRKAPRSRMATEDIILIDLGDQQPKVETVNLEARAEAIKSEGNQLYSDKQYKAALAKYNEVIALCPYVSTYYGNRAACYMMLYQYRDALADAKKCIQLNPEFTKAYTRVIKCCLVLGEVAEAEAFMNKRKALDGSLRPLTSELRDLEHVKRYLLEADAAYAAKDYRKVVYCMDRCCDVSTSCLRFKLTKAECLVLLERYQEAQEIANATLLQDKTNADATYLRGMCLYYQDNVQLAFTHFQEVLRLAPDHTRALEMYKKAKSLKQKKLDGTQAFNEGRYQDAYYLYTEALNVDPENKSANSKLHFNKATAAAKLGRREESISECTEALKLDENYLKALLRRAACYMELHSYKEAVEDYEKACKMNKARENRRLLREAKIALRMSLRKDYYKILNIDKGASKEDIKKAYKKQALIHHPDRHANASEDEKKAQEIKFKDIGEAYAILSHPKKRLYYDTGKGPEDENLSFPESENYDDFFGWGRSTPYFQFQDGSFSPSFSYFFNH